MNQLSTKSLRQVLLLLLIAALFGVLSWNLRFFVPALLGAYTLYVLLRGPLVHLVEHQKWSPGLARLGVLLLSFVAILLPICWIVMMLQQHLFALFQNSDSLLRNAEEYGCGGWKRSTTSRC